MDLLHEFGIPFFRLGVHHIATGWDHLAFLLGLLLFRQTPGRLAVVVTAFTLAHSLTLACAALGWVHLPERPIEILIALSIVYVGVMALWRPRALHGPLIAGAFGLAHGFGFAGALSDALADLGQGALLVALAGFNLGIEAFQLLLVALAWPLLRWLDRDLPALATRPVLAAAVALLGLWWSVERVALS